MDDLFAQSLERLLKTASAPAKVREIERGGAAASAPLWAELESLGLGNALLAEDDGGAGLGFAELAPLVRLMGRYLLPVPLAETMVARGLLARGGSANTGEAPALPSGPIVLAAGASTHSGDIFASAVPLAQTAELVLLALPGIEGAGKEQVVLTPLRDAEVTPTEVNGSLAATLRWRKEPAPLATFELPAHALRDLAATLHAAEMASAMDRLLEMTVEYAGVRQQFGKPLAKFQALQQQLAVMAEQVLGANMAVALAFDSADALLPAALPAALAKQYVSAVSPDVTSIASAVHGAIALSEEYDLQLFARRVYELRLADGTESYWARRIGAARLAAGGSSVDFVRRELAPSAPAE